MSFVGKGRIIRGAFPPLSESSEDTVPQLARKAIPSRRVPRAIVDAEEKARVILRDAEARANTIVEDAKTRAKSVAENAAKEARDAESAKLAAAWLAIKIADERRADRDVDRVVSSAMALAERVVGVNLSRDPALVAELARQALTEAKGARRAVIRANAEDAKALAARLAELGLAQDSAEIVVDPELDRGSLIFETDIGTLDARLRVQLERLATALREALRT